MEPAKEQTSHNILNSKKYWTLTRWNTQSNIYLLESAIIHGKQMVSQIHVIKPINSLSLNQGTTK